MLYLQPRVKKILINMALLAIVALFCIAALELAARFTTQLTTSCTLYEKDDELSFRNKANAYQHYTTSEFSAVYETNAQGLREKEEIGKKKPGELRILTLGDSFVYGLGLNSNETFQKQLEKRLANVEVINAGVPGFGTVQTAMLLKRIGPAYQPDIVIAEFFNNDVIENIGYETLTFAGTCLIGGHASPARKWLYTHSRLYLAYQTSWRHALLSITTLRNSLYSLRNILATAGIVEKATVGDPVFGREYSEALQQGWQLTLENLGSMQEWCGKNNCTFILTYVPSRIQANHAYRTEWLQRNRLSEDMFDLEKPVRILENYSTSNNITFVNLWQEFEKRNISNAFYTYDPHFNANGAKAWADVMKERILHLQQQ